MLRHSRDFCAPSAGEFKSNQDTKWPDNQAIFLAPYSLYDGARKLRKDEG